jgi:hypothetical protein
MFGDAAKRLQDPEMKEMINAMDPVVSILRDEPLVCIQENSLEVEKCNIHAANKEKSLQFGDY